ncbi:hypothetical protein PROFUN_06695 [Planoprotostelium fungivorum]|uniref:Protein kinase domain-containing protein n=1 Tax=Planoprotostelium fungivorum TaxID=1890364 RepID=A0A2P6NG33_9EUKA|nr:hypothetical protein PROFUN_06695 [Planoprotostelium fungivorum]
MNHTFSTFLKEDCVTRATGVFIWIWAKIHLRSARLYRLSVTTETSVAKCHKPDTRRGHYSNPNNRKMIEAYLDVVPQSPRKEDEKKNTAIEDYAENPGAGCSSSEDSDSESEEEEKKKSKKISGPSEAIDAYGNGYIENGVPSITITGLPESYTLEENGTTYLPNPSEKSGTSSEDESSDSEDDEERQVELATANFLNKERLEDESNSLEVQFKDVHITTAFCQYQNYVTSKATSWKVPLLIKQFNWPSDQHEEFAREARNLRHLRHSNILLFVGYTIGPCCLLFEAVDGGSLRQLMEDRGLRITHEQILNMLISVAQAMSYLHSQNPPVLHQRLTAESILIGDNFNKVRVTNFGNIVEYESDVSIRLLTLDSSSSKPNNVVYPWEWNVDFTTKSDAFMFAVVVWECVTRRLAHTACQTEEFQLSPEMKEYYGIDKATRRTLHPPKFGPPFLLKLMEDCMLIDPEKRPTFHEIRTKLEEMRPYFFPDKQTSAKFTGLDLAFQRDLQSVHFHSPDFSTDDPQLKVRYIRSFCTVSVQQKIIKLNAPLMKLMQKRGTAGGLTMHSSYGLYKNYMMYDKLEDVKEADYMAKTLGFEFYQMLEEKSDTRCERTLMEVNDWCVKPGANYAVVHSITIPPKSDREVRRAIHRHVVPDLKEKSYWHGMLFIFNPAKENIQMIHFLKSSSSLLDMQNEGEFQKISLVLLQECRVYSIPYFEGYNLGISWVRNTRINDGEASTNK